MQFQWIHLHESESPPCDSSDHIIRMALTCVKPAQVAFLFALLLSPYGTMLVMLVLSDSFLDCLSAVEYFQEESLCVLPRSRCKVKTEGECRDEVRTRASLTLLQRYRPEQD